MFKNFEGGGKKVFVECFYNINFHAVAWVFVIQIAFQHEV